MEAIGQETGGGEGRAGGLPVVLEASTAGWRHQVPIREVLGRGPWRSRLRVQPGVGRVARGAVWLVAVATTAGSVWTVRETLFPNLGAPNATSVWQASSDAGQTDGAGPSDRDSATPIDAPPAVPGEPGAGSGGDGSRSQPGGVLPAGTVAGGPGGDGSAGSGPARVGGGGGGLPASGASSSNGAPASTGAAQSPKSGPAPSAGTSRPPTVSTSPTVAPATDDGDRSGSSGPGGGGSGPSGPGSGGDDGGGDDSGGGGPGSGGDDGSSGPGNGERSDGGHG